MPWSLPRGVRATRLDHISPHSCWGEGGGIFISFVKSGGLWRAALPSSPGQKGTLALLQAIQKGIRCVHWQCLQVKESWLLHPSWVLAELKDPWVPSGAVWGAEYREGCICILYSLEHMTRHGVQPASHPEILKVGGSLKASEPSSGLDSNVMMGVQNKHEAKSSSSQFS